MISVYENMICSWGLERKLLLRANSVGQAYYMPSTVYIASVVSHNNSMKQVILQNLEMKKLKLQEGINLLKVTQQASSGSVI